MTESSPLKTKRVSIGQLLMERGILNAEQIEQVLRHQKEHGLRFASSALTLGLAEQSSLVAALAAQRRCASLVIEDCPTDAVASSGISVSLLRELGALPCRSFHRTLVVAVADPGNARVIGALESLCRRRVQAVLCLESVIQRHLADLPESASLSLEPETRAISPTPAPLPIPPAVRSSLDESQESIRLTERQTQAKVGLRDALRALKDGAYEEAIAAARKSIKADPFDGRAHFAMARALSGSGRQDEALTVLEQTVALEPEYFAAWKALAMLQEAKGNLEESVYAWNQAVHRTSDDDVRAVILQRLGYLNEQIGVPEIL